MRRQGLLGLSFCQLWHFRRRRAAAKRSTDLSFCNIFVIAIRDNQKQKIITKSMKNWPRSWTMRRLTAKTRTRPTIPFHQTLRRISMKLEMFSQSADVNETQVDAAKLQLSERLGDQGINLSRAIANSGRLGSRQQ